MTNSARRRLVGVAFWLLATTSAACSLANQSIPASSGPQLPGTAATGVQIRILSGAASQGPAAYGSNPLVISPGITVTWINADTMPHTVTAEDGSFDSGPIAPGQAFSRTFNAPGKFLYFCTIHGKIAMSGAVEVGGPPPSA